MPSAHVASHLIPTNFNVGENINILYMSVNVDGQMLYSNIRNICVGGQSQSIYYELIVDCILILHFAFI